MPLSISAFAKLAGVSRQAIYDALKNGRAYRDPTTGKIDPEHATNKAYIKSALSGSSRHGPQKGHGGTRKRKVAKGGGNAEGAEGGSKPNGAAKAAGKKSTRVDSGDGGDGAKSKPASDAPPTPPPQPPNERYEQFKAAGIADPETYLGGVEDKTYWDTRKSKEQALTALLEREKRIGNLVEFSVVASLINGIQHGIQANLVDAAQRFGIQICQMLGLEGKESEVIAYLESEIARALEEVDRATDAVRDRLKRPRKPGA